MKTLLLILLFALFISCNNAPQNKVKEKNNIPDDTTSVSATDSSNKTDAFFSAMKKAMLQAFDENELRADSGELYRLILYKPGVSEFVGTELYRVWQHNTSAGLMVKTIMSEKGKAALLQKSYSISSGQWQQITALINGSYFWSMDSIHVSPTGLSENLWILEGAAANKTFSNHKSYHCVLRWNPYEGSFKAACNKIKELASIQKPDSKGETNGAE